MIGESVRAWRQKNSMTQKELGERLGVRAQTVSSQHYRFGTGSFS